MGWGEYVFFLQGKNVGCGSHLGNWRNAEFTSQTRMDKL
jgi:hypothetical protein